MVILSRCIMVALFSYSIGNHSTVHTLMGLYEIAKGKSATRIGRG
jgi:hypothetical protein